jgi:eukaryotic-like serine/threonine-protein kinase
MVKLRQLREKRLVQIVLSYLAGGWVLLQVTDQLINRGVFPDIVYVALLIWFAAGIPAAILVGWHHGEKGNQTAPRSEVISLFALAMIALVGSGFAVRGDIVRRHAQAAAEHPLDMRNVAVLYFQDQTDDPEMSYVVDGLTEDLITSLRQVRELDVLSKNATTPFRGSDIAFDSIANELDVGTLVSGSVEKRGDRIAVNLQLIDGKSGAVVERTRIEKPATDLLAVRADVVDQAVDLLRQWIGKELRLRQSSHGTTVREAWALVQRAEKKRKDAEQAVRKEGPGAGEASFSEAVKFLENAQKLDATWPEPAVQLTAITYRRSRLAAAGGDLPNAMKYIEAGLQQAEKALALAKNEPRALELRGTLRYFKWLLNQTADAAEREQLLANARSDLETAVGLDPSLAGAYSTLSHLLYNDDLASAIIAARNAYEADAYLEVAADVVWRLFYGNFDLENFTQAREWCSTGRTRFPEDHRYAYCELRLMASPAVAAKELDVQHGWKLVQTIDSMAPAPRKPLERVRAQMAMGGVLARTGARDSADAVLRRARSQVTVELDPAYDLMWFEAAMRLMLHERDAAFDLLRRAVLANPDQGLKRGETVHWLYRELQNHPNFEQLYTRS